MVPPSRRNRKVNISNHASPVVMTREEGEQSDRLMEVYFTARTLHGAVQLAAKSTESRAFLLKGRRRSEEEPPVFINVFEAPKSLEEMLREDVAAEWIGKWGWRQDGTKGILVVHDGVTEKTEDVERYNELLRAVRVEGVPAYDLTVHMLKLQDNVKHWPVAFDNHPDVMVDASLMDVRVYTGDAKDLNKYFGGKEPFDFDKLKELPVFYREQEWGGIEPADFGRLSRHTARPADTKDKQLQAGQFTMVLEKQPRVLDPAFSDDVPDETGETVAPPPPSGQEKTKSATRRPTEGLGFMYAPGDDADDKGVQVAPQVRAPPVPPQDPAGDATGTQATPVPPGSTEPASAELVSGDAGETPRDDFNGLEMTGTWRPVDPSRVSAAGTSPAEPSGSASGYDGAKTPTHLSAAEIRAEAEAAAATGDAVPVGAEASAANAGAPPASEVAGVDFGDAVEDDDPFAEPPAEDDDAAGLTAEERYLRRRAAEEKTSVGGDLGDAARDAKAVGRPLGDGDPLGRTAGGTERMNALLPGDYVDNPTMRALTALYAGKSMDEAMKWAEGDKPLPFVAEVPDGALRKVAQYRGNSEELSDEELPVREAVEKGLEDLVKESPDDAPPHLRSAPKTAQMRARVASSPKAKTQSQNELLAERLVHELYQGSAVDKAVQDAVSEKPFQRSKDVPEGLVGYVATELNVNASPEDALKWGLERFARENPAANMPAAYETSLGQTVAQEPPAEPAGEPASAVNITDEVMVREQVGDYSDTVTDQPAPVAASAQQAHGRSDAARKGDEELIRDAVAQAKSDLAARGQLAAASTEPSREFERLAAEEAETRYKDYIDDKVAGFGKRLDKLEKKRRFAGVMKAAAVIGLSGLAAWYVARETKPPEQSPVVQDERVKPLQDKVKVLEQKLEDAGTNTELDERVKALENRPAPDNTALTKSIKELEKRLGGAQEALAKNADAIAKLKEGLYGTDESPGALKNLEKRLRQELDDEINELGENYKSLSDAVEGVKEQLDGIEERLKKLKQPDSTPEPQTITYRQAREYFKENLVRLGFARGDIKESTLDYLAGETKGVEKGRERVIADAFNEFFFPSGLYGSTQDVRAKVASRLAAAAGQDGWSTERVKRAYQDALSSDKWRSESPNERKKSAAEKVYDSSQE